MKQRIRVAGIVRKGGEVLLLKRAGGRAEMPSWYELPTGKINFGEQPEEAMARIVYDCLGERTKLVRLVDVITFVDLKGSSRLANLYIVYEVGFEGDSVKITTERYSAYRWAADSEIGSTVLDEASLSVLEIVAGKQRNVVKNIDYRGGVNVATIYTDGGSRGNPGPSGIGYYIVAADGTELKRGGEFLGFSTSRMAEYYGLKEGVEQALELGLKSVRFMSDSLMLVNQMNGVYAVKNQDLVPVYNDIWALLNRLDSYSFEYISRMRNVDADREVNRVIDEHLKRE
ncbi:reverse transcriptase-like protein [Candidatus Saccharibacteria bacterium]|nr:reverse transcriptase-like protein [Candidatus Saccharibacteria bacterium]